MSNSVDHARAEILAGRFTSALATLTKKRALWVANYYPAPQSVEIIKFGDLGSGR